MPAPNTIVLNHPALLRATARRHYWEGVGTLSIKLFRHGRAFYQSQGGSYAVEDDRYLILNDGQPYSISIDSSVPVESFCIFFPSGFAEMVHHSLSNADHKLLDVPTPIRAPLHFVDRTYPHDALLTPAIEQLRTITTRCDLSSGWLEEQLHSIMGQMLYLHQQVNQQIDRFPAVRAATREELYRRLYRAHDYILAFYDAPLTLSDMAAVATLSVNHFLRAFKQVFHQTPHQYLTDYRLKQACKLLVSTDSSVTQICFAVGFESLGSFSYLFRRHYGLSPDRYRREKGDFREVKSTNLS